jgi:hypothetical protein
VEGVTLRRSIFNFLWILTTSASHGGGMNDKGIERSGAHEGFAAIREHCVEDLCQDVPVPGALKPDSEFNGGESAVKLISTPSDATERALSEIQQLLRAILFNQ